MKSLIFLSVFFVWNILLFIFAYNYGKNTAQNAELKKDVGLYQKREERTLEQEKTAEKIKIIYKDIKSDDKDCEFVLNFNVNKCLPK